MANKSQSKPFLEPAVALHLILRETNTDSERGFVMLCAAVVDRALEKLIRMKFIDLSHATEDEINFLLVKRPQPPLGSAGIRARIARVLGVIDKNDCNAICKLFDIRNHFAHDEIAPILSDSLIRPIWNDLPKEYQDALQPLQNNSMSPKDLLRIVTAALISVLFRAQVEIDATIAQLSMQKETI